MPGCGVILGRVQDAVCLVLGNRVTSEDVVAARKEGSTYLEIHDTVLIVSAFCLYNRYVDGFDIWATEENKTFDETGHKLAHEGYLNSFPI